MTLGCGNRSARSVLRRVPREPDADLLEDFKQRMGRPFLQFRVVQFELMEEAAEVGHGVQAVLRARSVRSLACESKFVHDETAVCHVQVQVCGFRDDGCVSCHSFECFFDADAGVFLVSDGDQDDVARQVLSGGATHSEYAGSKAGFHAHDAPA